MIARALAASLLVMSACAPGDDEVVVLAAASLTEAFQEIAVGFEEEDPSREVALSFAGSALLSAQILQGAPADVFASADTAQMDAVVEAGKAGPPATFATNRIVLVAPRGGSVRIQGVRDLAEDGVRVVLGGREVPVGAYAREYLERRGLRDEVERNVVSNETDTKEVLAKVLLGEADAGVVYATDVSEAIAREVEIIPLPGSPVVRYPVAPLADGGDGAAAFIAFLLSPAAQRILESHGFGTP